ncbi:MAG TPA: tRNA dihydrouridine synthase DusB [Planctomycetaceae bacterium]|nr:tRNA dihydrouridine synthase DusB [Planctomycetaceae bacterium]
MSAVPSISYGTLRLPTRWLLSPLAGFTNLPFRRVVRALGGLGLATTDLVNARALCEGSEKTLELTATCPEDTPLAVQIFGADRFYLTEAARRLEGAGHASVDINMGCPVGKVTKTGSGASLMCRKDETVDLVESVVKSVQVPVTVKMRLGWDEHSLTAPAFARAFEEVGVAAVAIHGRTRAQGFSGSVNRDGIRQVVEAVRHIPVIGNGDVRSVADAQVMLRETGCAGVSIGRGALANPWIFRQLHQWEQTGRFDPPGHFDDRLGLLRQQFQYVVELRGASRAVPFFRKMAHWYLKAMRVPPSLRHKSQLAHTVEEFEQVLAEIAERGPAVGTRTDQPDMTVSVPSGPNAHW